VRLAAQLLAQPWVVPSAQSRGPPSEEWPEPRLDTRPVKLSIRHFKVRPLLARSPYSDYEAAYHMGNLMSSKPVHAIAGRTLRHWTIDSQEFVGKSQQAAPALPYSEQPGRNQFHLLVSKLARVKSELVRRVS
jgi:hypothetical protein